MVEVAEVELLFGRDYDEGAIVAATEDVGAEGGEALDLLADFDQVDFEGSYIPFLDSLGLN